MRVPVARQATYPGSSRARRGAILRLLAVADGHKLVVQTTRRQLKLDRDTFEGLVSGLERDGLLHRSGRRLRLGGAPTIAE